MFISGDWPFLSVPVRQITANPVTTGASSKSHLHAGAIAGGTIGVAALLAIGAALLAEIEVVGGSLRSSNQTRQ